MSKRSYLARSFPSSTSKTISVASSRWVEGYPAINHTLDEKLSPDPFLPPPVLAKSIAGSTSTKRKKSARIEEVGGRAGLRVHWSRLRRRLGTGTSPSTTSSLVDESAAESSVARHQNMARYEQDDEVDEVVVDRNWSEELKSSVSLSEQGGSPDKTASHQIGGTTTDHESFALHVEGVWALCTPLIILRWRLWPAILDFFSLRFYDEKAEAHYAKENWFMRKSLALWSSVFLILNWILGIILIPNPRVLADKIFYYGLAPAITFPILFMVMYDFPRDRPNFYQFCLSISLWSWAVYQILFIFLCGKYDGRFSKFTCGDKDFLGTFYYACALPTMGLFGLRMKRFPAFICATIWTGLAIAFILPHRVTWIRNVLNFMAFHGFLIYVHYMLETSERRLYTLRDQLKIQFRATQKAQVNERKASDSKRRLTSYVFHEVRVPLNTALLAVQNMQATATVPRSQDIEFKALEGSLTMMSKVLNDVLDFNRMDSGRFESVSRPYCFHEVMRSLFVPLRLAANARQLEFITDLDKSIDRVARFSAYAARGLSHEAILKEMEAHPDEDGLVTGDETRLMQIITNLASNACKFTPSGGMLRVATKLVLPTNVWTPSTPPPSDVGGEKEKEKEHGGTGGEVEKEKEHGGTGGEVEVELGGGAGRGPRLSANSLSQHNLRHSKPPELIVVRIEVQDTGYGILPKELEQSKLFSAFNQTEQGKQQGGKGTGLGLALVRQIVKRSGGRLGLSSKVGKGSTFWVELPLGVGAKTLVTTPTPTFSDKEPRRFAERPETLANGIMSNATRSSSTLWSEGQRPSSAMHSIMDQGGMVELVTKPGDGENPPIITRTIKDTIPQNSLPTTPEEENVDLVAPSPSFFADSAVAPSGSRKNITLASPSKRHQPDKLLQLPPPLFDPQITPPLATNSTGATTVGTDQGHGYGHAHSSSSSSVPPAQDSPTVPSGLQVLVVDDDPLTRMLMSRMLTRLGCKVTTAENGEVALDLLLGPGMAHPLGGGGARISGMFPHPSPSSEKPSIKFATDDTNASEGGTGIVEEARRAGEKSAAVPAEGKYAVVFLDNQMPVMSGLRAVSRLRELGRSDFVVGVTGNALLSDQEEYLDAGVDRVLTKPVLERSMKGMLMFAAERRNPSSPVPVDSMASSS
ncbi:hypothetical protein OF83DRAFT_1231076 [Amylostereum chailletii]|nr:hypothetical protein OF83DRAFT_1231076 [Amylostereum chailletii]